MSNHRTEVYEIAEDAALDLKQLFEDPKRGAGKKGGATSSGVRRVAKVSRTDAGVQLPTNRSAPIAATLSMLMCGAGQFYNGQMKMGALFLLLEAFMGVAHWAMARMWPTVLEVAQVFEISQSAVLQTVFCADVLFIFFVVGQVLQAYHHADTWGEGHDGIRYPFVSGLASAVLPGWGQMFNAQIGKAGVFLFFVLAGTYVGCLLAFVPMVRDTIFVNLSQGLSIPVPTLTLGMGFLGGTVWLMSVYDAYLVARYRH